MTFRDMTIVQWEQLSWEGKEACAKEIERSLQDKGINISFRSLEDNSLQGRAFTIARFESEGDIFHFVPGGEAQIGFDVHQFTPSKEQLFDYAHTAKGWGVNENLRDFLKDVLEVPETRSFSPLLVQCQPQTISESRYPFTAETIEELEKSDNRAAVLRDEYDDYLMPNPQEDCFKKFTNVVDPAEDFFVQYTAYGEIEDAISPFYRMGLRCRGQNDVELFAQRYTSIFDLEEQLMTKGRRLPKMQEWQRLNLAGATTLFSWGNYCPATDKSYADRMAEIERGIREEKEKRHREWLIEEKRGIERVFAHFEGQALESFVGSEQDFPSSLPNLYGLAFAGTQTQYEIAIGESFKRNFLLQKNRVEQVCLLGGDGGSGQCGGIGDFASWLSISPHHPDLNAIAMNNKFLKNKNYADEWTLYRSVIEL